MAVSTRTRVRKMNTRYIAVGILASCLLYSPAVEAKKVIVAVFNVEFSGVRMAGRVRDALRDYIETRLTSSGAYEVVPPDQLKKALSKQKIRSYKKCYKQSCQISIGQELSADRTLSTKVTRIGRTCMVSMKLYHLKRMTSEKGETARGKCTEQGIMDAIQKVVDRLAKSGGGSTGGGGPAPVVSGPSVSGGEVTSVVARLIVQVRPRSARVKVTGPGRFSATGGSSWEHKKLKPGTYQVLAGAAGYAAAQRTVTLGADDLKTVTIKLKRPGKLVVTGSPAGARVEISGPGGFSVVRGLPLVKVSGAAEGTYTVKVSRAGYGAVERQAQVSPGSTTRVAVTLKKGSAAGKAGIKWVTIPGGSFMMGSNSGVSDEKPVHRVTVGTFRMSKTEVTNAQYRACVRAGKCRQHTQYSGFTGDTQPVVGVSWKDARSFCHWAGGRLPSEAEWEYAARSGGKGWKYPWGNAAATCSRAVMDHGGNGCGKKRTWPVCSKTAGNTTQGLCDMAGNVWEWTEDCWHGSYSGAPSDGSAWTRNCSASFRVDRGGSWSNTGDDLRAAYRGNFSPGGRLDRLGVRCAR